MFVISRRSLAVRCLGLRLLPMVPSPAPFSKPSITLGIASYRVLTSSTPVQDVYRRRCRGGHSANSLSATRQNQTPLSSSSITSHSFSNPKRVRVLSGGQELRNVGHCLYRCLAICCQNLQVTQQLMHPVLFNRGSQGGGDTVILERQWHKHHSNFPLLCGAAHGQRSIQENPRQRCRRTYRVPQHDVWRNEPMILSRCQGD